MKLRRNLRIRKARGSRHNPVEGSQRVEKWPAWKRNPTLARHIYLLK